MAGRWQNLIERAPVGIIALDREGRVIEWNPGAESIFGWSRVEAMGKINPIVPEESIEGFKVAIGRGLGGCAMRGQEIERRTKDGSMVWVRLSTSVLTGGNGEPVGLLGVIEDISEKRSVRQALIASEKRFRTAFHTSSPDAIALARLEDGRFDDINRGFSRITGFDREDVLGKTSIEIGMWVDPADRNRMLEAVAEEGSCENLQARFRCKDGHVLTGLISATTMEIDGEVYILSATKDISDRIAMEEDLRRSRARLELFHALDRSILEARSIAEVADAVFEHLGTLVQTDRASLAVFDEGRDEAVVYAHGLGNDLLGGGCRIRLEDCFSDLEVMRGGAVRSILDFAALDEEEARGPKGLLSKLGISRGVQVPVMATGTLLGSLNLARIEARDFSSEDIGVVREIVDSLAVALVHARLNEELAAHADGLEAEVGRRTFDLRKMVNLMAGRENRMADLKEVILILERQLEDAGIRPAISEGSFRRP